MKKYFLVIFAMTCFMASAQTFKGLTPAQQEQIKKTKIAMPLPTWLPAGFKATSVITRTSKVISTQEKVLSVTYTRKLKKGGVEGFTVEAGFDGLGDMPYENGIAIRSNAGVITLYYEPLEEMEDGKKEKVSGLVQTEWFNIKRIAFHVVFSLEPVDDKKESHAVITSLPDAKKILASMAVLKL